MAFRNREEIRVLHIDDDSSVLDLTKSFLEREEDRFTIETTTDTDEGLQIINDSPPDCVVSDYDMPGMNGLEFLQVTREEYPEMPFILFTGKGSETVAGDAISAGVTDYLQKETGTKQYELLANRIKNAVCARRDARQAERQENLMRLTEIAGDTGGWELDVDSNELVLTLGTQRLLGVDSKQISFEQLLKSVYPDDRKTIRSTVRTVIETQERTGNSCRLRSAGDVHRRVDITMVPVTGDGDVTTIRGSITDITEYKQRELKLRQYRDLLESVNDAVFVVDQDMTVVYANEQSLKNVGTTAQKVDGEPIMSIMKQYVDSYASIREFERALTTTLDDSEHEEPESVELTVVSDDSESVYEYRFSRISTRHIASMDGEISKAVAVVARDVTDKKERMVALEQTETLFDNAQDMLFIIEHSEGQFVVKRVNSAFESVTGLSNEELRGKTPQEVFGEERGSEIEAKYRECVNTGESLSYEEKLSEEQVPNKESPVGDGLVYWKTHITPVEPDGDVDWIVGATRDINEQKRRERTLERRNERLDEFTSIIGHDLRNPLNVAEGRIELARNDCESDHLPAAADAIKRCQTLLDDTLALARQGEQIGELNPVSVSDAAEQSWRTVVTDSAELDIETDRTITADRSSLQQLFENLYRNAVEHGGSAVTVRVGETNDGFYVADTGSGVSESDHTKLFEAGYSTQDNESGFGLRIVKAIADGHGWEITVTESVSGGARFEFSGVQFVG